MSDCGPVETFVSFFLGVTLSGNTGLKATIPLFLLSVFSQTTECVQLSEGLEWIGSVWFSVIIGLFMAVEVIADLIPGVAHILHAAMTIVHPIFGAIVAVAPLVGVSWGVRIPSMILGGLIALVLHIGRVLLRFLVAGATAGCCNPCVSILETLITFIVCPLAIFIPIAAILFGIVFLISFLFTSIVKLYRKINGTNVEDDDLLAVIENQTEPKPWVDDKLATHCHLCAQKFNLVTRKHHCRWCGNVFCDTCSSQTCEVPTLPKQQRVCNRCYTILTAPPTPSLSSYFGGAEGGEEGGKLLNP